MHFVTVVHASLQAYVLQGKLGCSSNCLKISTVVWVGLPALASGASQRMPSKQAATAYITAPGLMVVQANF